MLHYALVPSGLAAYRLNFRSGSEIKVARRDATTESACGFGTRISRKDAEQNRWIDSGRGKKERKRERGKNENKKKEREREGTAVNEVRESTWDRMQKRKIARATVKRRDERRWNKYVFFYDSLYLGATAGYFVSKRIKLSAYMRTCNIREDLSYSSPVRIYCTSFCYGIIGHRSFSLPPSRSFRLKETQRRRRRRVPTLRIRSPGCVLRDSLFS